MDWNMLIHFVGIKINKKGGNRLKKMHHLVENLAAFSSNFFIVNFVLNGIIIGPCVCCYEKAS